MSKSKALKLCEFIYSTKSDINLDKKYRNYLKYKKNCEENRNLLKGLSKRHILHNKKYYRNYKPSSHKYNF
jgi:hypothetical protein